MIEQIVGALFFAAFFYALGFISKQWFYAYEKRKPYLLSDIENICKTLTSFELLRLAVKILVRAKWTEIRPEAQKDFDKCIENFKNHEEKKSKN